MVRKQQLIIFLLFFISQWSYGQNSLNQLSLYTAYELLENRYPALKNSGLLEEIYQKEQQKLDKSQFPDIYLKADGKLQSQSAGLNLPEGTNLPFSIDLPLYSVKTYLEAQYHLLDGNINEVQQKLKGIQLKADLQDMEVKRYALRERVNQLFVNISILRQQNKLFDISIKDLGDRKKSIAAGVEEGILLESELTKIRVKELEVQAQQDNVHYALSGLMNALSQLLGITLSDSLQIEFPNFSSLNKIPAIDRPEQKLFEFQQEAILANSELIDASNKPRLIAFAQAGLGYPNPLNFLDNSTAPYGVVGLQFNWKITNWQKDKIDKEILSLQAKKLQHAKETFEFNLETHEANYFSEIARLQELMKKDTEIADLQAAILAQMAIQLEEGIITSADYIIQVNAELKARQNILVHQAELLKIQVEFWNERGGFDSTAN